MGIVIITIPGEDKRAFVNSLYKKTDSQVDLVIIQQPRPNHNSIIERFRRLYRAVGPWRLPKELFYAVLLRTDEPAKETLGYFRAHSAQVSESEYLPKILETRSVNSPDVHAIMQQLSPDLLVIWGSAIVRPHILATARQAINLHMGLCPHYRGAIANQRAVMHKDLRKIGATIHMAGERVDTGDILAIMRPNINRPPRELFKELNDWSVERFIEIAAKIHRGDNIPMRPQENLGGDNFKLRDWTPSTRYKVARQMLEWEKAGVLR